MTKNRKSRIFRKPLLRTSFKIAATRRMMEATAKMRLKGNLVRKKAIRAMPQVSPGLVTKNRQKY